jgi:D-methionine transport system substrate-binding protein
MSDTAPSAGTQGEIKKSRRGPVIALAVAIVAVIVALLVWFFVSQGGSDEAADDAAPGDDAAAGLADPFTVTATSVPHGIILEYVRDELAQEAGIDFEIDLIDTYPEHNRLLDEGESDANYFQHLPYFEEQVEEFGYELHAFPGVHIEPYAAFSERIDTIQDLPAGATISITNDGANQARALQLLADEGLVSLPDSGDVNVYTIENPNGYEFLESDPANQARALADVDLGILNGNFFLQAGYTIDDALLVESTEDNPFANFLASREEDRDDPRIVALDGLLRSPEVRAFIEERWPGGDVFPAF